MRLIPCFAFAFLLLLTGSGSHNDLNRNVSQTVTQVSSITDTDTDGILFAIYNGKHFDLEKTLVSNGIPKDSDNRRLFVPFLSSYPGWFDFGLAAKAAKNGDGGVYLDGQVRVFQICDETCLILVLSPARAEESASILP